MKKVCITFLTTCAVLFWVGFPPSRMESQEVYSVPQFDATHIDSIATLKTEIEIKIAETQVELMSIMIKSR
jgi:hypothetical protein